MTHKTGTVQVFLNKNGVLNKNGAMKEKIWHIIEEKTMKVNLVFDWFLLEIKWNDFSFYDSS